jgi:hypothetical protein
MRYLLGFLCVCALGVVPLVGCGETAGDGGSGGAAGSGGTGGDGGTGGTAGQCDDGTQAAYDSAKCDACAACASEGPCQQCNAQSCQDFLGCALSCPTVECTASCIDRYPAGAHLFGQAVVCGVCDTCPNNCGFPAPPFWCDSAGLPCFQDDECTGSLICCQPGDPSTLGVCVTQAECDELQDGSGTGGAAGNGGTGGSDL